MALSTLSAITGFLMYTIRDAITEGAAILANEWSKPRETSTNNRTDEADITGEGDQEDEDENLDEDVVELTEEDLSVEGMLA